MRNIFILFVCFLVFAQQDAHAYINPGTGSDFFQMLIGIILGIAKFFKTIIRKIKNILGFKPDKKTDNDDK